MDIGYTLSFFYRNFADAASPWGQETDGVPSTPDVSHTTKTMSTRKFWTTDKLSTI